MCEAKDWCNDEALLAHKDENVVPDWADDESLRNWVEQYDGLACAAEGKKSLIGSTWFIGWVVSLIIVPRIADNFGRRWAYLVGMVMTVAIYTGVMLAKSVNWLIVL